MNHRVLIVLRRAFKKPDLLSMMHHSVNVSEVAVGILHIQYPEIIDFIILNLVIIRIGNRVDKYRDILTIEVLGQE